MKSTESFILIVYSMSLISCVYSQNAEDLVDISNITMFPQGYDHRIFAGYLNITPYGKSHYYFFFQSQSNPANDPVILWLNGGPGCSSLMGFVSQHGPFLFKPGTTEMYINPYSWNKKANVIYMQSPGGVGFAYASQQYMKTNDTQTAKDNLVALRVFFEKFRIYQGNDFYLAGQSYAGIYIPMLARQILEFNEGDQDMRINLRGTLLGNPCTHPLQCYTAVYYPRFFTQFLYTHGFLDQSIYNQYNSECLLNQMSQPCIKLQEQVKKIFVDSGANIYNVYGTCYYPKYPSQLKNFISQQKMQKFQSTRKNLKHPLRCSDALGSLTLFNTNEFRQALHVGQLNDTLFWTPCSDNLDYYIEPQATFNILPQLVKAGLKIIYFSGDQDAIVPLEGTMWWFQQYRNQFGAAVKKSWRPWITNSQNISGMVWQLQGLTLATVVGAGHMVPSDKPVEAEEILNIFLGNTEWKQPDYFSE